jgi:hypothetical protein
MGFERPTRLTKDHSASGAFEEVGAELLFEQADAMRDGRLRAAELARRPAKAAFAQDRKECRQGVAVHGLRHTADLWSLPIL